jgi:succinate dehydrogenase/fumarate reductase flavoprotein subunit
MFPGMVITYALMEALEDIAEETPDRAKIIKKARVTQVLRDGDKSVGVEYEYDGKTYKEYGPVVLATGGYAADFGKGGLLEKHRPDLLELSTTNGDHCTGDGQKMVFPGMYVIDSRSWQSEERVLTWIKFKSIQLVLSIQKTLMPKSSSLPRKPSVVSVVCSSTPEEIVLLTNLRNVTLSPTQCGNVTNSPSD